MKKHNQEYVIIVIMAIFIEIAFLSSIFARPRYFQCQDLVVNASGNSNTPSIDSLKVKTNLPGSTLMGNTSTSSSRTYLVKMNKFYGLDVFMLSCMDGETNSYNP
jgi:hypothetical protein